MEVVIALDSYDDLFSDFDIRPYADRALSKDLLDELRVRMKRHWMKPELSIVFMMPASRRIPEDETLVVSRVRRFFSERHAHYRRENRNAVLRSAAFALIGLALFVGANWVVDRFVFLPLLRDFLLIPSWFFVWSGFELMIKKHDELGRKRRYYAALAASQTVFRDL